MANPVTLKDVANTLVADISILSKDVRTDKYNRDAHMLSISSVGILEQIKSQLPAAMYTAKLKDLTKIVNTFTKAIYEKAQQESILFVTSRKGPFVIKLVSLAKLTTTTNINEFRVFIASVSGRGSAFNKGKTLKAKAEALMIADIKKLTGKEVSFDIGHTEAVSLLQAQDASLKFINTIKNENLSIPYSIRKATSYKSIVKASVNAQRKRKLDREYLIKISEVFPDIQDIIKKLVDKDPILIAAILEDSNMNTAKGRSEERKAKNKYLKASKDLAKTIDFTRVKSSPSFMDDMFNEIIFEAVQSGGKIKGRKPRKSSPSSSRPIEREVEKLNKIAVNVKSTTYDSADVKGIQPRTRKTNWLQLLPLINAKLTPQVIKNMGSPKLNFRTGRLAQSAQVVNVEQTREGFPSFVFDYERDPYDVFDRTLGRSPWNTPQRDPRALVDQSVREIVREMAIGRFFTRRA